MNSISRRKFVVAGTVTLVAARINYSWALPVSGGSNFQRAAGKNSLRRPGAIVERQGGLVDGVWRTRVWVAQNGGHRIKITADQHVHVETPYMGSREVSIQALRHGDANDEIRRCFSNAVLDELLYEVSRCQMPV